MAPVPPSAPRFCLDVYEASLEGAPSEAQARSTAGVLPAVGVTWVEAAAACARTPMWGEGGGAPSFKHLATASEWEDGGDGVPGAGGPRFPWGDAPAADRCALAPREGPAPGAGLVPTGSHPDCAGPTGVYDLVGNAWEWVDSGARVDLAAWSRAAVGLERDGDVLRVAGPQHLALYALSAADLEGEFTIGAGAALGVRLRRGASGGAWLVHAAGRTLPEQLLPVHLGQDGSVRVDLDLDGAPIPEKRGGAWYAGWDVDLRTRSHAHLPDFRGTIGFRCAGPANGAG